MAENPRILELRRRVQADPASIAFAQLAEECRRAGAADEAIGICRAGLARHPGYLSARVTLGRALIEVGRLDEAATELMTVAQAAPDNLAANRGLAEIHQQRGEVPQALTYYQRALQLARHDPDLEDSVERLSQAVGPAPSAPKAPHVPIEELFDFDALLKRLGDTEALATPSAEIRHGATAPKLVGSEPASVGGPSPIDTVDLTLHAHDPLAEVERDLRSRVEQRAMEEQITRSQQAARRQAAVLLALEKWLGAVVSDRQQHDLT